MTTALIFLILGAIFGFIADTKLEDNPTIGIPATVVSLMCTLTAIMLILLNRNSW